MEVNADFQVYSSGNFGLKQLYDYLGLDASTGGIKKLTYDHSNEIM